MTDPHHTLDPVRLVASSDDALLKNVLRAAEREVASGEQMALVAAKLGPIVGGADGAGDAGAGAGAAASAGLTATTRLLGALGIGITVAASGAFFASRSTDAPRPIASAPSTAAPIDVPPPTATTLVPELPTSGASGASGAPLARAIPIPSARTSTARPGRVGAVRGQRPPTRPRRARRQPFRSAFALRRSFAPRPERAPRSGT